jgi:CheY-like chemotaxis protein
MTTIKNPIIYIVDDDADDREFIMQALSAIGLFETFMEFEDGQKVVDYLKSYPIVYPDLILLDLNMPVKNGFDTLQEVKSDESLRSIPIIILTASSKVEDEKVCFRHGCEQYYQKPLSMEGYKELAGYIITYLH